MYTKKQKNHSLDKFLEESIIHITKKGGFLCFVLNAVKSILITIKSAVVAAHPLKAPSKKGKAWKYAAVLLIVVIVVAVLILSGCAAPDNDMSF